MKLLLLSVSLLAAVNAGPNVIADYRIRNPDITPALGRGYSLTTYGVLSTCLQFEERTEPTYNYDYEVIEVNSAGEDTSESSKTTTASVGYFWAKTKISTSVKESSKSTRSSEYILTRMATERYYSSLDDSTASLTRDALALVERGDLVRHRPTAPRPTAPSPQHSLASHRPPPSRSQVGFFQSCGSGYIRSIRRTAELAAVFEFSSSSETRTREVAVGARASFSWGAWKVGGGARSTSKSTSDSSDVETKISIKAFGIGLNLEGADTLIARNLEEYDAAIKFAFRSMQTDGVGQIHGVEVVSWMNNMQFQNAVRFKKQQEIDWIFPPGYIPADSDTQQPPKVRSDTTYIVPAIPAKGTEGDDGYVAAVPATSYPVMIESIEVKAITMINAEFITGLEAYYQKEMYTTAKFLACLTDLNALAVEGKGDQRLKDNTDFVFTTSEGTTSTEQMTVDKAMTVVNAENYHLRMNSLRNFVKHFYGKCASEISRYSEDGAMTKYWWDLDLCLPILSGSAATSAGGGGSDAPSIQTECLLPGMVFSGPAALTGAATCALWPTTTAAAYSDNFLDKYCMPTLCDGTACRRSRAEIQSKIRP